jgi:hypothetical protein
MPSPAQGIISGFLARLERPLLFKIAAGLFIVDLLLPDPIPFLDELIFGIVTLILTKQKNTIDTTIAPPPSQSGG